MSTLRVDTLQTKDGQEVYTAKAWVNFNGTGTVAIRAAGNVSSITDNGTGDYTVNFTNAMVDENYSLLATAEQFDATTTTYSVGPRTGAGSVLSNYTASTCRILYQAGSGTNVDPVIVNAVVFR